MLAAARNSLATVQRLAAPVTPDILYVCLQPLVILYGPPDFGQDEAGVELQKAWFDIYATALKDHPRESIELAVSECIRLRKYNDFPKPGYLNELAQQATDEIRLIAFRLKLAVERADQHRPPPERTPEDAAHIKALVDDLKGADGKVRLTKSTASTVPPSNRAATAQALRRLADFQ